MFGMQATQYHTIKGVGGRRQPHNNPGLNTAAIQAAHLTHGGCRTRHQAQQHIPQPPAVSTVSRVSNTLHDGQVIQLLRLLLLLGPRQMQCTFTIAIGAAVARRRGRWPLLQQRGAKTHGTNKRAWQRRPNALPATLGVAVVTLRTPTDRGRSVHTHVCAVRQAQRCRGGRGPNRAQQQQQQAVAVHTYIVLKPPQGARPDHSHTAACGM